MFRVIDESRSPSGHATGGHIHAQFNTRDAAAQFAESMRTSTQAAGKAVDATVTEAKRYQEPGFKSDGWNKAGPGGTEDNGFTSNGWKKPTTEEIVDRQPPGINGRGGGGGRSGAPVTINNAMTINGRDKSPAEIANLAQRKITEDWNHRGHNLEPELV